MTSTDHAGQSGERRLLLLLSGPNLQLFGQREPEIYGSATLADHVKRAEDAAGRVGWEVRHVQSDAERDLVAAVHAARSEAAAVVVNAGALSHYGWSLHDALAAFPGIVVELHVSNPARREPWRSRSVIAPVADGVVAGFRGLGYELAVEAAIRLHERG
jgi:3-dehydroquinate dehydratase